MIRTLCLLLMVLAASPSPAAPVLDLRLIFVSQTVGEVDPCG